MKNIEINNLTDFQFISKPGFSLDGKYAAFILQKIDLEANKYVGDIYVLDISSKQVRRLTASGDAKSYVWTKRGTLLFSAIRDAKLKKKVEDGEELTCWYEISPCGGEAELSFVLPVKASNLTVVDEDRYVVAATFDNNRIELNDLNRGTQKEGVAGAKNSDCVVLEEAPFWSNGDTFTSGKRSRRYLYTRSTRELKAITGPWFNTTGCAVRDKKVLYRGLEWHNFKDYSNSSGYYLYDIDTGESRCVLPPDTIRNEGAEFWDDDCALLMASDDKKNGPMQYKSFYTMDLGSGKITLLAEYEASIGFGSVCSDARLGGGRSAKMVGDRYYFITTKGGSSYLRYIDRTGMISDYLTGEGSCDSFDVYGDDVLVCGLYGQKLAELYLNGEQVTFFNDIWSAEHSVSVPEYHTFVAKEGEQVEGWAMKPVNYEPGKRYPAILHIHGGPRTAFGSVFHHEMQVWANAGYFVFFCNPHGSDGRGNGFADIAGKYGTIDYSHLMQFTDEMLAKYSEVDPGRVGVTGGSYGGFMTNWIIGHTDRFKAAVSQRSISNWIAFEHTSDIGTSFTVTSHNTNTRENAEKLWWHSPLKYVHKCTTPTLFIHADCDYRCWMVEGLSMFTALKMNGCDSRLCLFKGENHELSRSGKPRNRIRRMEEILAWMDKYLK